MHLYDNTQFAWKLGTLWIPIRECAGILSSGAADASQGDGGAPDHGACTLAASELTGFPMTTADEIYHFMPLPADWDMDYDIRARIMFAHAAAAADADIDWGLLYKFYASQDALTDCRASGDGTVVFAAYTTSDTDDSIEITPWTALDTISSYASGDIAWAFCVELTDDGGAAGDECELLGVEFQYTRSMLTGGARRTL